MTGSEAKCQLIMDYKTQTITCTHIFSQTSYIQTYAYVFRRLLLLRLGCSSIHLHPRSHNPVANRACIPDINEGDVKGEERKEDPEHVEEDEVDPEEHEVASIEVLVHCEPFGGKGHEACVSYIVSTTSNIPWSLCRGTRLKERRRTHLHTTLQ